MLADGCSATPEFMVVKKEINDEDLSSGGCDVAGETFTSQAWPVRHTT